MDARGAVMFYERGRRAARDSIVERGVTSRGRRRAARGLKVFRGQGAFAIGVARPGHAAAFGEEVLADDAGPARGQPSVRKHRGT